MSMFQREGMREGGLSLPPAFWYLILWHQHSAGPGWYHFPSGRLTEMTQDPTNVYDYNTVCGVPLACSLSKPLMWQAHLWACGRGDLSTPSFVATLTLSQPGGGGADFSHPILVSTPNFESHRHASNKKWQKVINLSCFTMNFWMT